MGMKVAINGFGRIGKQFLIAALEKKAPWTFIINEPYASLDDIAYTLKYDSVHPGINASHDGKVLTAGHKLMGGTKIKVFAEKEPEKLPWRREAVDLVVECTGAFTERAMAEKHLAAGAKRVLISAPAKNHDATIVMGANAKALKRYCLMNTL
jgi:glyceraldehyde 3-phosphate dehydrogenase